ncbi:MULTISPECIES: tyrosine-type recombinase/integrase [unclassified Streptomyces]|uniref:tyrosine-type recombinase/integrase n=1 Tax=unclassified Streptomyces TaxID=2593676 RepID=UPI0006B01D6A|nr:MULTISPECIES: site-specific integrase [unclassified Streptomyces]KOU85947.1 integrase [Streptomyces sp. XY58]KOV09345.1 integrase [Streptomyces sp. XY37]KOV51272.1 integrase [Streptomyces sp. MMG1064]
MTAPKRKKARANGEGTIYQRKDGRWEAASYVLAANGTRKRVRVYGSTRREAADKLAEKISDSNRGLPVATADSTVGDYLTYWLGSVAVHRLRENTHTRYVACARLHLIPGLGTKRVARLTAKDIRTFLDRLRTTCQCCTQGLDTERKKCCAIGECCQKQLSPLTVTYVHSVLKSALEHAVREDELPRNVARNVKTTAPRPRRFRPLTAVEARQFLDAARADRLHALYELALRIGLRKGELLGLHWEDLDLNGGTASIRRSLQRTRAGGLTHLPTKTRASERRIALPTECLHSLKEHKERQGKERKTAGPDWRDSGLVFTTPTGGPLDQANLTRRFRSFLDRTGLRRIRFHDLRHSTATLLLEQGVDLVVIKELLGHAHIGVTAGVYTHVRLRLQRQAIDTLGNALGPTGDEPEDPPAAAVVR